MLSIGMSVGVLGPRYVINKIPVDPDDNEKADDMRISMELGTPRSFTKFEQV